MILFSSKFKACIMVSDLQVPSSAKLLWRLGAAPPDSPLYINIFREHFAADFRIGHKLRKDKKCRKINRSLVLLYE